MPNYRPKLLATGPARAAVVMSLALALGACGGGNSAPEPVVVAQPPPAVVAPPPPPPAVVVAPPPLPVVSPPPPPPVIVEITGPGELKEATRVNTFSAADIASAARAPDSKVPAVTPLYAVTSYRLKYLTIDGQGKRILASGLVSVPVKGAASAPSPVISYQHGSVFKDAQAPSNLVLAGEPPQVLASLGYVVLAADYVGYGASKGAPHPYLLSAPTAAAVIDFLTAARTWRQKNAVLDNGQLFLLGYSEGGYATLAAHRALQLGTHPNAGLHKAQLLGSVPGAGPYHLGAVLDVQLDRVRRENALIGGLLSPGLLRHLGSTVRNEVRRQLIKALLPDDADVSFQGTFVDNYLADDNDAIERDSNVHDWKPETPVRLFHGRDDQTVPYVAVTRTLQAMRLRGAPDVQLTDCSAVPASHLGCVQPYFAFMLAQLRAVARDL